MEATVPASRRGELGRRCAPIACGAGLVAGAAFLATHDPSASGFHYPGCAFHQMTGLWCPGCGLTRGSFELLHGHVGAALGFNIFTPLVLVAAVIAWGGWLRASWGGSTIHLSPTTTRWLAAALPTLVIAYGVLRNLPMQPFRALAP